MVDRGEKLGGDSWRERWWWEAVGSMDGVVASHHIYNTCKYLKTNLKSYIDTKKRK